MNFNVRVICGEYQEMTVDAIETGTIDKKEAIKLAQDMISAADELLYNAGLMVNCNAIVEDLDEYL